MAKAKTKKKYIPRKVMIPRLITMKEGHFTPLFLAIDKLLNTGEVELDSQGVYAYTDILGKMRTIESSLFLCMRYVDIYSVRNKITLDIRPLERLQRAIKEKKNDFTETEIMEARRSIEMTQRLMANVPTAEHMTIMKTMYTEYELRKGKDTLPVMGQLLAEV